MSSGWTTIGAAQHTNSYARRDSLLVSEIAARYFFATPP